MKHYLIGGSSWARTLRCPAWAKFCNDRGLKSADSEAAETGRQLHDDIERVILSKPIDRDAIKDEDKLVIAAYEQLVSNRDFNWSERSVWELESTLEYNENIGGTVDLYVDNLFGDAYIVDFKFGSMPIEVINNKQLLFYAALLWKSKKISHRNDRKIILTIIQPAVYSEPQFHRVTVKQVQDELKKIDELDKQLNSGMALEFDKNHLAPDNECFYCPALGRCPKTLIDLSKLADTNTSTDELMKLIPDFQTLKNIKRTITSFETDLISKFENGDNVVGFGLKPKRSAKFYTNVEDLEKKIEDKGLRSMAYSTKLLSPAQMKISCAANAVDFDDVFSSYIASASSGNTLSSNNDVALKTLSATTVDKLKTIFRR